MAMTPMDALDLLVCHDDFALALKPSLRETVTLRMSACLKEKNEQIIKLSPRFDPTVLTIVRDRRK